MSDVPLLGRRVPFTPAFPGAESRPGDYCLVPPDSDFEHRPGPVWYAVDPTGKALALSAQHHSITEHEDGTITVSPSIVAPGGWHGFLERGVWSA